MLRGFIEDNLIKGFDGRQVFGYIVPSDYDRYNRPVIILH